MIGGLPGDTGGISGSGFPSGGVTGNLSMISPASTMALQSVHTRSPVYPFSSCVGSLKPCRWRFKWHVGSISPYSFPHFSQTAFFVQVACPPEWTCCSISPSIWKVRTSPSIAATVTLSLSVTWSESFKPRAASDLVDCVPPITSSAQFPGFPFRLLGKRMSGCAR